MQLKIFKGVLEQEQFKKIKQFFFDINTSWFYQPKMITKSSNDDRGFFSHALFHDSRITSNAFELMSPLFEYINAGPPINIRANLNVKYDISQKS